MKPIKRGDHNFVYKGPDPEIGDLSCRLDCDRGYDIVVSHWRPSEEELALLNDGGAVELEVLAQPLPPVALNVVSATEGEGDNAWRQEPKPRASVIGRRYRWRGKTWTVRCRWAGAGPRNVLIENDAGELVVRPFRGLRRT